MSRFLSVSVTFLTCLAFVAGTKSSAAAESSLTANSIYQKECAKCHGKTAEGRHFGGPSLVADKTVGTPADDLRDIIAKGKRHMPKFGGKLSDADIDTLVQQIKGK